MNRVKVFKSNIELIIYILITNLSFAQLQQEELLENIFVVDSSCVFITSRPSQILTYPSNIQSAIYKSTDGGHNWKKYTLKISDIINNIVFTTRDTGFISTYYSSKIFRTVNGGETWDSIYSFQNEIRDMKFLNSKVGFIVGVYFGQYIYRTSDGGISWLPFYSGSNQFTGGKLSTVDKNIIYATNWCCDFSKSIDGGFNWVNYRNKLPAVFLSIWGLQFTDENNGFIIGSGVNYANGNDGYPIFAYTSNGGMDWNFQYFKGSISDLHFANSHNGWLIASNQVYYSNNRFTTKDSTQLDLKKFAFISENVSLGISDKYIYKTYDGWRTFNKMLFINTDVDKSSFDLPEQFILEQNYPNPFNPITNISFSIPEYSHVTLKVFDLLGREISMLLNKGCNAGKYEVEFNGKDLSCGIYFYTLIANNFVETKKLLLVK